MNSKTIDCLSKLTIESVEGMSRDELQAVVNRPFKPSAANSEFDLEKWCAQIILICEDLKLNAWKAEAPD